VYTPRSDTMHVWTSHGTHKYESWHIYLVSAMLASSKEVAIVRIHTALIQCTCGRVMVHTYMSHGTHMNPTVECHIGKHTYMSHGTYIW